MDQEGDYFFENCSLGNLWLVNEINVSDTWPDHMPVWIIASPPQNHQAWAKGGWRLGEVLWESCCLRSDPADGTAGSDTTWSPLGQCDTGILCIVVDAHAPRPNGRLGRKKGLVKRKEGFLVVPSAYSRAVLSTKCIPEHLWPIPFSLSALAPWGTTAPLAGILVYSPEQTRSCHCKNLLAEQMNKKAAVHRGCPWAELADDG